MQIRQIKYEKDSEILDPVDGKKTSLIKHLSDIREKKHITKKQISQLIRSNDYWYAQLEQCKAGALNQRRKYIDEMELINIISIIIFDVKNKDDLPKYREKSKWYIDALNLRPVETAYRFPSQQSKYLNDSEQFNLIDKLLNSINRSIIEYAENLSHNERDNVIERLKEFNSTTKRNPLFALDLAGLRIAPIIDQSSAISSYKFLNEIQSILDTIELETNYISYEELGEKITSCYDNYLKESGYLFSILKAYDIKF